jgi:preprotein translocase subunit SecY
MAIGFGRQGLLATYNVINVITVITALTAGSAFLMWIGERITEHGVGNGISIVLTINILSRLPQDITSLFDQFVIGRSIAKGAVAAIIIIGIILLMVVLVIVLNDGVRKIPVQYAKKIQGRKMVGGQSTNIPLKVNTSGVIPVIFASSILQLPIIICSLAGVSGSGIGGEILKVLNSNYWCDPDNLVYSIGLIIYIVLVIFFAYFYTSITFNPLEIAENMKKQGGFIPGIRPGKPTSDYLTKVLNRIVFIGAVGLTIVCVLPYFFNGIFGASVSTGGTSLIIIVSVVLETVKQIESQMLVRNYKGFLND